MGVDRAHASSRIQVGFAWGAGLGLLVGVPGGALKAAGYPNEELYLWWSAVGAAFVAVLVLAMVLALRRSGTAIGLVAGATVGFAIVPALTLLDILTHSE